MSSRGKNVKAIELFGDLEKGILHILQAADLYAIHLLSNSRKEEPDQKLIQCILAGRQISTVTVLGVPYTKKERKELEESGVLQDIGNQIVLATYTALEFYLTNKFKEYFRFRVGDADGEMVEKVLGKFWFQSLKRIKALYKDLLGINLPCFEIDMYFIGASSSFRPISTWEGITTIERARHEIAHEGRAKDYKVRILPDAWEPFDFVRRWVDQFDMKFDCLVYEGRSTHLIKEYQKRIAKMAPATRAR